MGAGRSLKGGGIQGIPLNEYESLESSNLEVKEADACSGVGLQDGC